MKKISKAFVITGLTTALCVPFAMGTPEYAKKENRQCIYCHTAVGKPDLNDAGRYYKAHHTLEGYTEKKSSVSLLISH